LYPMPLLIGAAVTSGISTIKQVVRDAHDNALRLADHF
jgi:hypothetical protein